MKEKEVLELLQSVGAVIINSHIVYTSGRHGNAYINKDAIYPQTDKAAFLCLCIAQKFAESGVDAVIAPAIGGVILSQWIAHYLTELTGRRVLSLYAEKDENGNTFVIKRGYDKFIPGKKILVAEDVLTTGGSVRRVVEAVRSSGGTVIGVGAICNRGGITAPDVADVPELFSLINLTLDSWSEAECPLCGQGVPINTDVGKGREFLARKL